MFSVLPFNIDVAQACGPLAHDDARIRWSRIVHPGELKQGRFAMASAVSAERINRRYLPVWRATDHQNARLALGRIKVGYSAAMSDCCATRRV